MKDDAKPSEQHSQTTGYVWEPQAKALEGLYGNAADWYGNTDKQIQANAQQGLNLGNAAIGAVSPAWMNQLGGGNLGQYNITDTLSGSLMDSMNNPSNQQQAVNANQGFDTGPGFQNGNINYIDAKKQSFYDDARGAADMNLQAMDARAAASGMSGGSRHGTAIAQGAKDITSNLQSNLANIGYEDYQNMTNRQFQDYTNSQNIGFQDYTNQANLQAQAGGAADAMRTGQQQLLADLAGQQNQYVNDAIGQQQNIQGYINAPQIATMGSAGGITTLGDIYGNATGLSDVISSSNGGILESGGTNLAITSDGPTLSTSF